jgi:Xaa-Pro aminopeptidase
MKPHFNSDFFRQNRHKLRTLFTGKAPIVLTANGLLQRNGDAEYLFRQDSSFWYLTGIDMPGVILVMDKAREYLIVPERDSVVEVFDGRTDLEALERASGIKEILSEKDGWKRLSARMKKVQHVATLAPPPAYVERFGLFTNPARARMVTRLKEANSELELLDLRTHLARMRAVKQPIEIEAIQKAIDITIATVKDMTRKLSKYEFEYEIEADITQGFRKRGAMGHAYFPIVASGKNTCTLHYAANNAPLEAARLIYVDLGAEFDHYAADITRTYFLKPPTKREAKVYQSVLEAQEFAKGLLKPGVLIREYESKVEHFMGEKLRELGLIKTIEKQAVRTYFPHATSHSLGLDAHDAIDYDRPLEPGAVLTIEPGIYIPEEGIGIRVEDDIVLTEDGVRVLSEKLPHYLIQ